MFKENKVTVLTLVYNGMPYLKDAIDSILNQTYKDFDYLLIDDNSSDNSVEYIQSLRDPRIKLIINDKNLNTSDSFNKALNLIKTKYIVRLDQDDISENNRIQVQLNYLESNPHISIISSWEKIIDSNGKFIMNWKSSIKNYGDFLAPVILGICPLWHPSIMFKTNDLIQIGGFNSKFARAEDFDVTSRFALNRLQGAIVPFFLLRYRKHQNSQSAKYDFKQAEVTRLIQINNLNYFLKNNPNICIEKLSKFLTIDKESIKIQYKKNEIILLSKQTNVLLNNIFLDTNMSDYEIKTFKNYFYFRIGYGVKYFSYFINFNSKLFLLIFYFLSPQRTRLKIVLKNLYYYQKNLFYYDK